MGGFYNFLPYGVWCGVVWCDLGWEEWFLRVRCEDLKFFFPWSGVWVRVLGSDWRLRGRIWGRESERVVGGEARETGFTRRVAGWIRVSD